jgi:hypothetical protein
MVNSPTRGRPLTGAAVVIARGMPARMTAGLKMPLGSHEWHLATFEDEALLQL